MVWKAHLRKTELMLTEVCWQKGLPTFLRNVQKSCGVPVLICAGGTCPESVDMVEDTLGEVRGVLGLMF